MKSTFERQRRNLNAISIFMFILYFLDINLTKINLFGNELIINDSSRIDTLLWILWAYFLIRYYQYFREVGNNEFISKLNSNLTERAKLAAKKMIEEEWRLKDSPNLQVFKDYNADDIISVEALDIHQYGTTNSSMTFMADSIKFKRKNVRNIKPEITVSGNGDPTVVDGLRFKFLKLKSALHTIANTRSATEFYLPFCISILPIVSILA